jgi:hypothetical protein
MEEPAIAQLTGKFSASFEATCSLPCSKQPATDNFAEPDESISHPHTVLFEDPLY